MIEIETKYGDKIAILLVNSSCEKAVTIQSKAMPGSAAGANRAWMSLDDLDRLLEALETARFDLASAIEDAISSK